MNEQKLIGSKKNIRAIVCLLIVVIVFAAYLVRLFQWQIIEGKSFNEISEESSSFFIKLNGTRGEIFDKDGNLLVGNKTTYNITMNAIDMDDDRNPAILMVLKYLSEDGIEWIDKFPIKINGAGEYYFVDNRDAEIAYLKSSSMLNTQDYATADECMQLLVRRYDVEEYSKSDARNIISVRYNMTKVRFSVSEPYTIAEDVPLQTIQKIAEHAHEMPGIGFEVSTIRKYGENANLAPHLIGAVGSITAEQYQKFAEEDNVYSSSNVSGYAYSDKLGQNGAEGAFENVLRGKNGKIEVDLGTNGDALTELLSEVPSAGDSVYLTIDSDLQRVANKSLEANVKNCNYATNDCKAGGVVVLDVKTFGVLAAATYPTYDLELYANDDDYYENLLKDKDAPMFNRAFDGIFTPGSVFKPLVAIAALEEKIIDTNFTYSCPGYYNYYNEENPPTCYNSIAHGDMNIYTAIMNSCNVFFMDVGRRLTVGRMNIYADAFGLGVYTGVEISEANGIMSNQEEYIENHGTEWVDGLTLQTAIGQCDSMFSPLQLATYTATIANNGVRLKTHLLDKITDYDGTLLIEDYEPEVVADSHVSLETMQIVQGGMRLVGENGTAADSFAWYDIKVGCKTGTAENPGHEDNTVFIAYAPFDKPEIAVGVVLEYGREGEFSRDVALDIFDKYFFDIDVFDELENPVKYEPVLDEDGNILYYKEVEEKEEEEETQEDVRRGDDIPDIILP